MKVWLLIGSDDHESMVISVHATKEHAEDAAIREKQRLNWIWYDVEVYDVEGT